MLILEQSRQPAGTRISRLQQLLSRGEVGLQLGPVPIQARPVSTTATICPLPDRSRRNWGARAIEGFYHTGSLIPMGDGVCGVSPMWVSPPLLPVYHRNITLKGGSGSGLGFHNSRQQRLLAVLARDRSDQQVNHRTHKHGSSGLKKHQRREIEGQGNFIQGSKCPENSGAFGGESWLNSP